MLSRSFVQLALAAALAMVFGPAVASSVYRCTGEHGETVFTSNKAGFSGCRRLAVPTTFNSGQVSSPPPAAPVVMAPIEAPAQATTSDAPPLLQTAVPPPAAALKPPLPLGQAQVEFRTRSDGGEVAAPAKPGAASARVTRGAVYRYVKDGVTHYTNRRPSGQRAQVLFSYIETCFACAVSSSVDFNAVGLNLTAYADEVRLAANLHGIEEALVRAVIHAESAFNVNALSNKGAQGLMQLMPDTAARFGVTNPFSAQDNIGGGAAYLAWLLRRFDGDVRLMAAGYNAGEGAVDRFGGVPPYAETQVFVERVGVLLGRYRIELAAAETAAGSG